MYFAVLSTEPPTSPPTVLQTVLQLGLTQGFVHIGIDLVGDVFRCLRWRRDRDQRRPRSLAAFRRSSALREATQALAGCHGEQLEITGLDEGQGNTEIVEHQVDVAGEQAGKRWGRPSIRDGAQFHLGPHLEKLGRQMRGRADALRGGVTFSDSAAGNR